MPWHSSEFVLSIVLFYALFQESASECGITCGQNRVGPTQRNLDRIRTPYIVNGQDAMKGEIGFQVALTESPTGSCKNYYA